MLHYTETNGYLFTDILNYYIYFCIGDILSAYFLGKKNKKTMITAPSWMVASTIVFLASQYLYTIINIRNNTDFYVGDKMPVLSFFISLSGCAFIIQLSFMLQRLNVLKWLRVIGYHSLYIYLLHVMIIAAVRIIVMHVFHSSNIFLIMLLAMVAGVILPVIIYNLAVRLGAWWLFSLKKPVDEIRHYSQSQIAVV
jgi:fucose 4-O-acetylase-like acetyltransferase